MSLFGKIFKGKASRDTSGSSVSDMSYYSIIDEDTKPARWYEVTTHAIMAIEAFNKQNYQECTELITKEFQNSPENSTLLTLRAKAFYNLKEYKSALPDLNKVLSEFPYHRSANTYRGLVLYKLGDILSTIASVSKAIESDPEHHIYYFILNDCYRKKNDHKKANEFLLKGEKLELMLKTKIQDDNNPTNKYFSKNNFTEPQKHYPPSSEIDDLQKAGYKYLKQNNYEEGLKCYLKRRALEEERLYKNYNISIKEATKKHASDLIYLNSTYETLGNIYKDKKEYEKAIPCLEKALKCRDIIFGDDYRNSHAHDTHMALGHVYSQSEYYLLGMSHYQKALDICKKLYREDDNQNGTKYINTCYFSIGVCYFKIGDFQDALPLFEKVLQINKKTGSNHMSNSDVQNAINKCREEINRQK
ncbi:MAG: tetratricopeptide repeat protein [Tannerella sp.]|jgi:tetratricopeptide (TPR) repeat protein|nr:tetratricopeptide repeat protein [Tannerella sp.]